MGVDLATQDKSEWARQEFEALLHWEPTERVDPWRRTSGLNTIRSRRGIAVVRELWYARDDIAQDRDTSPGRILPDAGLIAIADRGPDLHRPTSRAATAPSPATAGSGSPPSSAPRPSTRPTSRRAPCAPTVRRRRARGPTRTPSPRPGSTDARAELTAFAEQHQIPVENVCSPDPLRRVVWRPPAERDEEGFAEALRELRRAPVAGRRRRADAGPGLRGPPRRRLTSVASASHVIPVG